MLDLSRLPEFHKFLDDILNSLHKELNMSKQELHLYIEKMFNRFNESQYQESQVISIAFPFTNMFNVPTPEYLQTHPKIEIHKLYYEDKKEFLLSIKFIESEIILTPEQKAENNKYLEK